MKSDKQLMDICLDIYREMYSKATPPADFDEMMKSGETSQEGFFMNYTLPFDEHDEILEKHMKLNKLTKYERKKVSTTIYLGCSPKGI